MNQLAQIEEQSTDVIARAESITIATGSEYAAATGFLKDIKALNHAIQASFNPIVDKAHKVHKEAIAQRNKHLDPVKNAERIVKRKVAIYAGELEAARKKEQARLEEEARKEREKAMQEALEASEMAEELKAKGEDAHAVEIQQEAMKMAEAAVEIEAPKVKAEKVQGVSFRDKWEIEIIDPSVVPRQWCIPDEKAILQFVKATKGKQSIEGVKIIKGTTTSVRE